MANSPSRVFAAVSPSAGDVYRDENESVFNRGRKQTPLHTQSNARVVQMTGCAELSCPPDRATVTISVKNSKEHVNDVTNSVTRRLEYILQTARQHDVKEENITVTKHLQREEELFHMRAEVLVVFSDFEKMQQARSVLIEKLDKSVCVGDPYYSHSAESLNLFRRRVCLEAVDNARLKASEACCILGQALGRPLLVREEESQEWTSGQHDVTDSPPTLHQKTGVTLVSTSSGVFVAFELRPKDSNRRK
ncbi:interleukin-1 receptor-associated kinase 1-binding protein 1 homolog [Sinocyclocheilus rhinocerous]|uniref:Interleukin-1 receptor-associated kinase 1-binding protein 1 homolog n=1 Tax=Sinocyclocheilus rhinocerous TaxID=307959 RepID=A0A673MPN3_9TELE|nr:PREDICTED: interleukin-1 receptor-associated kinase 1-binding protein 1 homolog [Sinocyclocheilus rhinocerous]